MTKEDIINLLEDLPNNTEIVIHDKNTCTENAILNFGYYITTVGHKQYYFEIDTEDII